jgi:hypothetical protein
MTVLEDAMAALVSKMLADSSVRIVRSAALSHTLLNFTADTSNPSNFGLDPPIQDLAPIVNAYSPNLSRADVWVLAGMVAAEVAQESTNPVQFEMEFVGRPVCPQNDPNGGPDRREYNGAFCLLRKYWIHPAHPVACLVLFS